MCVWEGGVVGVFVFVRRGCVCCVCGEAVCVCAVCAVCVGVCVCA